MAVIVSLRACRGRRDKVRWLIMAIHPLASYLNDCRSRRGTGATTVKTSLYPPLEALLNAAGHGLKPQVRCFMSPKNQGADLPNGGLFTPDQIPRLG